MDRAEFYNLLFRVVNIRDFLQLRLSGGVIMIDFLNSIGAVTTDGGPAMTDAELGEVLDEKLSAQAFMAAVLPDGRTIREICQEMDNLSKPDLN